MVTASSGGDLRPKSTLRSTAQEGSQAKHAPNTRAEYTNKQEVHPGPREFET